MSKFPELIEKDGDVMAYSKTNWTEATPITAESLNKMEQGIKDVETLASTKMDSTAPCSRFSWEHINNLGARIVVDGAGNNACVYFADRAQSAVEVGGWYIWVGSESSYNNIANKNGQTIYFIY